MAKHDKTAVKTSYRSPEIVELGNAIAMTARYRSRYVTTITLREIRPTTILIPRKRSSWTSTIE